MLYVCVILRADKSARLTGTFGERGDALDFARNNVVKGEWYAITELKEAV